MPDFYVRILNDGFRLAFQNFRVVQIALEFLEAAAEIIAGFNAFIGGHFNGDNLPFFYGLAQFDQAFFRLPHSDKDAGGAEIIDVVIDCADSDRSQIGNEQRGVKRTAVDNRKGKGKVEKLRKFLLEPPRVRRGRRESSRKGR